MVNKIEWISLKACIIILQENKCAMCKKWLKDLEFTLHHIIPRDKGGKDELYNLIGLCDKCHNIAELKELNREEIINYSTKYSLDCYNEYIKPIKKSYFMPEMDNQMEYKYPEKITLREKYIIKPKMIIIGFEVDQKFKEKLIKAGKEFKIDGIPYPLKLSGFCRIATEKLLKEVENLKEIT